MKVWCCPTLTTDCGRDKLQRFQFHATRVLTDTNYDISSDDLHSNFSRDTLETRRSGAKSVLMYKILNDNTAPELWGSFVRREIDQTNYHLRSTETDLTLPRLNREYLKKRFKYSSAMPWNQLPYEAKSAESLLLFKSIVVE